jgi:nucleotide-binding universal stress UspA family protein
MGNTIVVAVDGGPASYAALLWAATHATERDASLQLVTIIEPSWRMNEEDEKKYLEVYEEILVAAESFVNKTNPAVQCERRLRHGDPATEIIRASSGAVLTVIGTNKNGKIAGVIRGTLPLRVAGSARCPVIVVPVSWRHREGTVVVGYHDDQTADEALDFGAREAVMLQRPLHIIHACEIPQGLPLSLGRKSREDFLEMHRLLLSSAVSRIRAEYPRLNCSESLETVSAPEALVRAAQAAELLVVGSHRRGLIAGLILGSVSHDVLLNMPCPVAVVPHPDEPISIYPEILDEDLI